ncbi:hypothetical protein OS175_00065 [Marinicella sp. S1101]|uniref:hypothetical protein n=1 Tax=Marinicella marina TaxID=2996016 RepID=UPI002260BF69|nr:hypothetical protein [Marinicella marina]MCX7552256.1 hypothetical protein [Marinicella marina]MDJ1139132.1 hypothetical protein [Marinicella marina]
MKKMIYMATLILLGQGLNAQTVDFATVGNDNNCDFQVGTSRIQDAIDSGLYDEIRISTGEYRENLILNDIDMRLVGGFTNCTDAMNNIKTISALNKVTVSNLSTDRGDLLTILGDQNENTIYLEDMRFFRGRHGIRVADAQADIELNRVDIVRNFLNGEFNDGAGIGIKDGDVSLVGFEVLINDNDSSAANGGGLSCEGANNFVYFDGSTLITNNKASNDGGGIALYDQCSMIMDGGTLSNIQGNNARNGGGVFVNNAYFTYNSTVDGPARIRLNQASNDGGAVYATGAQSIVLIGSGIFESNSATVDGGGFYVDNLAGMNVGFQVRNGSLLPVNCYWSGGKCTSIINNNSTFGGAIYAETNGSLSVQHAYVEGNRADFGVVGYAFNTGSLDIIGSYITANGNSGLNAGGISSSDFHLFIGSNGGTVSNLTEINIMESTIADNAVVDEILISFQSDLTVQASIIDETNLNTIYDDSSGRTESFQCLVVHDATGLVNTNNVVVANPRFLNRSNGDYHLAADSPAIDLCDQIFDVSSVRDIDGDLRSFDDPTAANQAGFADAGADESILNDIIFKDGFD